MKGQTNQRILKPKLQRRLRNSPTDAEHRLWQRLRGRQIEGCKFRRQHPYGDFILDFVCLERRVIVELDGSQHFERAASVTPQRTASTRGRLVSKFCDFGTTRCSENIEGVLESDSPVLGAYEQHHPHPTLPLKGRAKADAPLAVSTDVASETRALRDSSHVRARCRCSIVSSLFHCQTRQPAPPSSSPATARRCARLRTTTASGVIPSRRSRSRRCISQALLNYEDRWFWKHPGVNPFALARAVGQMIWYRRPVSGGSTLTMQVARIIDPHSRSLLRQAASRSSARCSSRRICRKAKY